MRHLAFSLLFICAAPLMAQRAQPAPTMLHGPADWRFERLPIPPGFARDIPWSGYEEARFSPGMFRTGSPTYFTYALSICIDGTPEIHEKELKDFLDKYFKGLSTLVGRGKGIQPDPAVFNAEVKLRDKARLFSAKVPYIDTFTDGRQITLNLEIDVRPLPESKKTQIILLLSPQAPETDIWKKLHEVRDAAQAP
ncbi:hypothetical protein [Prosthecobacter sp.]|uniref:hypothetical protein n=1 Tax=Prosthecobacter sp. TaxID=1965333 RepID=UPI003783ADDE